ncbi:thiosulfate dehydrogenase [quinone] large subunit [Bradyrhizobium lablabi]|uniref:Thiosulfate dehydrogenase [quinone] large subunit n=1 Tax=Bradyrhizobium lablabi TaxID=722472 RepID=A0A1M7DQJ3_9BRAD|nr:TQO small subunit DoxD [Bradyrhizobium lablabi]SHL81784.1 thiosulfate dehydrogenase [quinone] large subunit [Bradyrhizobium lablabi]
MSTLMLDGTASAANPAAHRSKADTLRIAALALLSIRFIQGFIYWGGGSRRFIYAPAKLDPNAASWMANKFQSAMPGALLGTDHIIAFLLHHFYLLYVSLILFSAAELVTGLFLMAGFLTRVAALVSIGLSVALMLMFGWQGATCIDEWTMAACNLAIGATLMLGGSGAFSLDNVLLARKPVLAGRGWFRWMSGALPLPVRSATFQKLALVVFAATVVFNVATYNYYRGSVLTPFHGGPVSPGKHHLSLTDGVLLPNGAVRFHAYLDGGTPAAPSNVMTAVLRSHDGIVLEQWDGSALSHLPASAINNEFAYNRFVPGPFGLRAQVGAMATITLPAPSGVNTDSLHNVATLQLRTVNGNTFDVAVRTG